MRLAWFSTTAQTYAPYLGLVIVGLFLIDWLSTWDEALRISLLLLAGSIVALLLGAALISISDWDVSRTAERGLGARDVFTTALEFDDSTDEVHRQIQTQADRTAADADARAAIPITANRKGLRQFGMAAALAVVIGLLPPFGESPAISSDLKTAIEQEAEEVERIAEAVFLPLSMVSKRS